MQDDFGSIHTYSIVSDSATFIAFGYVATRLRNINAIVVENTDSKTMFVGMADDIYDSIERLIQNHVALPEYFPLDVHLDELLYNAALQKFDLGAVEKEQKPSNDDHVTFARLSTLPKTHLRFLSRSYGVALQHGDFPTDPVGFVDFINRLLSRMANRTWSETVNYMAACGHDLQP